MNHFTTPDFWEQYEKLPVEVQRLADLSFSHLKQDTAHPGVSLKKAGKVWTARIGLNYPAIAFKRDEGFPLVLDWQAQGIRQATEKA